MFDRVQNSEVFVEKGEKSILSYRVESSCALNIVVEHGADLILHLLFCGKSKEKLTCSVDVKLNENSKFTFLSADVCNGATQLEYSVGLCGRFASFDFNGLYISSEQDNKNIELDVKHNVSDCYSCESMNGIAANTGVGRFHGRIYVAPDAQRTEAYQNSRNLLLDDKSHIFTEPQLEIYADDVKCSHGAVVGQIDDDAVYYMRQRGIDEIEARKLLTEGFANDIVWRAGGEEQDDLRQAIELKLNSL